MCFFFFFGNASLYYPLQFYKSVVSINILWRNSIAVVYIVARFVTVDGNRFIRNYHVRIFMWLIILNIFSAFNTKLIATNDREILLKRLDNLNIRAYNELNNQHVINI